MTSTPFATVPELGVWIDDDDLEAGNERAEFLLSLISGQAAKFAGAAASGWTTDSVPDEVKLVVLQVAARVYDNPTGLSSENFGFYGYSAKSIGAMFTSEEQRTCADAGLVTGGASLGDTFSVPLRPRRRW